MESLMKLMAHDGVTLMELLVGSVASTLLIGTLWTIYLSQMRIRGDVQRRSGFAVEQLLPAAAVNHMVKRLEAADRVVIPAGRTDVVLYRTPDYTATAACSGLVPADSAPPAVCLDDAANFRWDEFRWDGAARHLLWYRDIRNPLDGAKQCSDPVAVKDITLAEFRFFDSGVDAVGVEPFGDARDNNMLAYTVRWEGQIQGFGKQVVTEQRLFSGAANLRFGAYSRVNSVNDAVRTDSGSGLAEPALSDPPVDALANLDFCQ